ncbi:MAG: hypothetical protein IJW46_00330 [Clostridia bacterium]|nr:hypothetical protein [Clostridia bacterium]
MKKPMKLVLILFALVALILSLPDAIQAWRKNGETVFGTKQCPETIHIQCQAAQETAPVLGTIRDKASVKKLWQMLKGCYYREMLINEVDTDTLIFSQVSFTFDAASDPKGVLSRAYYQIDKDGKYLLAYTAEGEKRLYGVEYFQSRLFQQICEEALENGSLSAA